jgi:hypothetical protein
MNLSNIHILLSQKPPATNYIDIINLNIDDSPKQNSKFNYDISKEKFESHLKQAIDDKKAGQMEVMQETVVCWRDLRLITDKDGSTCCEKYVCLESKISEDRNWIVVFWNRNHVSCAAFPSTKYIHTYFVRDRISFKKDKDLTCIFEVQKWCNRPRTIFKITLNVSKYYIQNH